MPELPEVETTRRGIEPYLLNQTVAQIIVRKPSLRWPIPKEWPKLLTGETFSSIERRAKYLLLNSAAGTTLIHLGMSGRLCITPTDSPSKKHDHVDIILENGTILRYTDPRRFGCILWTTEDPFLHPLLNQLGPEPLDPSFNGDYLFTRSRKRAVPIKTFLMDAKVIVGVGNIYANEVLYACKIHPLVPAGIITQPQYQQMAAAIQRILKQAIEAGGTTLKDFASAEGKPGYFKQELAVYGREQQPCNHCATQLKRLVIAQRTTIYCPKCQQEEKDQTKA